MDAKDIELVTKIINDALREYAQGQVPFAWVSIIVGGLVSAIGVIWAWSIAKDKKVLEKVTEYSEKIEALGTAQRDRDDARDEATRKRWEAVMANVKAQHQEEKVLWRTREERLEASRDAAKLQYENTLKDNSVILAKQLSESNAVINEATETFEIVIPLIQRESGR